MISTVEPPNKGHTREVGPCSEVVCKHTKFDVFNIYKHARKGMLGEGMSIKYLLKLYTDRKLTGRLAMA